MSFRSDLSRYMVQFGKSATGWVRAHVLSVIGLIGMPLLAYLVARIVGGETGAQAGIFAEAAAAGAAAVTMIRGSWQRAIYAEQSWLLIAVGLVLWAIGRVMAGLLPATPASGPHALGLTSAGYIMMTPFLAAGVLQMLPPRGEGARNLKIALDGLIGLASLVTISWFFILDPVWFDGGAPVFAKVVATVHVVGNIGLLMVLLVVGLRLGNRPITSTLGVLAFGILAFVVADTMALQHWLADATMGLVAGLTSLLTVCAVGAIGVAGSLEERGSAASDAVAETGEREPLWQAILPYPLALILVLIVAWQAVAGNLQGSGTWMLITALTVVAVIIVRQGLTVRDERLLTQHLSQQVDRDPLTGLLNQRKARERIAREFEHGREWKHPLAIALIDVDDFKTINDFHGHLAGDEVLRTLATTLTNSCRGTDVAARYAGDEFLLVLPGADVSAARVVCERILQQVQRALGQATEPLPATTISIGVVVTARYLRTADQLVAIADAAMYDAKENGKNGAIIVDADTLVTESSLIGATSAGAEAPSAREIALRVLAP